MSGKVISFIVLFAISIAVNVFAGVLEKVVDNKKKQAIKNANINNSNEDIEEEK